MSDYLNRLKEKTRWDSFPEVPDSYRLLCSDKLCSLSCANLRHGRISVTSVHGSDRHSYVFTKNDMAFAAIAFLNELSEEELKAFCNGFNKVSSEFVLSQEKV